MSGKRHHRHSGLQIKLLLILLLSLLLPQVWASSDEQLQRQVLVGARLFPALLAAYEGIEQYDQIRVLVLHEDNPTFAELIVETLQAYSTIRNIQLHVEALSYHQLTLHEHEIPQGIFLAQRSRHGTQQVINYSRQHKVLTFSPFRGDVERGILAGVQITDRVLPYINMHTLSTLPHGLRPFFLRVASRYEP